MKKHKKAVLISALLVILVIAVIFLLRWEHERILKAMYPRSFSEIVTAEAAENGLNPNLVYAVIRQESSFNAEAKSKAGAIGLMQLTPATFEWLQKKESGSAALSSDELTKPSVNIRYGCRFLALLLKRYGITRTALCAYNAGMGKVDSWLKDSSLSRDGKNLSSIPYAETRNYAQKVEDNLRQYTEIYGETPSSGTGNSMK
jgi:soluble lytic murein transglycosylase